MRALGRVSVWAAALVVSWAACLVVLVLPGCFLYRLLCGWLPETAALVVAMHLPAVELGLLCVLLAGGGRRGPTAKQPGGVVG